MKNIEEHRFFFTIFALLLVSVACYEAMKSSE